MSNTAAPVTTRLYAIKATFMTEHPLTQEQGSTFWAIARRFNRMTPPANGLHMYRLETDVDSTDAVQAASEVEHIIDSTVQFAYDITELSIRDITAGGI